METTEFSKTAEQNCIGILDGFDYKTRILDPGNINARVRGYLTAIIFKCRQGMYIVTGVCKSPVDSNFCNGHGVTQKPITVEHCSQHMVFVDQEEQLLIAINLVREHCSVQSSYVFICWASSY
jgi:hypothetical protein